MTVYYINPESGSDANTGLSWAQAWKTLRGLRVASIVPVAGDEFRFAKSPEYTPSAGEFERQTGSTYPTWYIRGVSVFDAFYDPLGVCAFQAGWQPSGDSVQARRPSSHYNGVAVVDVPSDAYVWENNYAHSHATAYAGEYNATGTVLFGINLGYLGSSAAANVNRISGAVRCHVPYTGPGDGDLPAGAITLSVYRDAALIVTLPLPAIRNSSTVWTPFSLSIPTLTSTSSSNLHFRIGRAGAALNRDNSPFGLEFTEFALEKIGGIGSTHTVMSVTRTGPSAGAGGYSGEIAGDTTVKVFYEVLNPIDAHDQSSACTVAELYNDRLPYMTETHRECFRITDVHLTGTHSLSPAGSTGVYDLNGSVGGTELAPILFSGGWDTSADTVDGVTIFSAGITHKLAFPYALFDLQQADHIHMENIGGAYGFASLVTRPRTLYLKGCMLPWSPTPTFGEATTDTHVSLEDMYINPMLLDGFGVIGDLNLRNVVGSGFPSSKSTRYCEVNNLSMYDAHVRDNYKLYVRGNAVLEQCTLTRPPTLISTSFGHSLVFKNHKPAITSSSVQAKLIPTAPESRWDLIDYQDSGYPTYSFPTTINTGATCDAKMTMRSGALPWNTGTIYPTALRGDAVSHTYTDGINDFSSSSSGGGGTSESSERGYTYGHFMGARPLHYSLEHPYDMGGMGDVLTPPWNYHSSGGPREVVESPDASAAGRVFLVKRFVNIVYRSPEQLFVMTGRLPRYSGGTSWATLKAIYVPRAGNYRAHFGLMKENLQFNFSIGGAYNGYISVPLTMPMPSSPVSSGSFLGKLGVYCNSLDGGSKTVDLYASTAAEAEAGGGNGNLDEWHDFEIDFTTLGAGLVELRLSTNTYGSYLSAIFDVLNVYERP